MADHSDAEELSVQVDDYRIVSEPEALKAVGNETRRAILGLLNQQPASTTELARSLSKPKGTIGHHLKVLEETGFITVVSTRKVRALTEKFYGRTARTFVFKGLGEGGPEKMFMVQAALDEAETDDDAAPPMFTQRYARIPQDRVDHFFERLVEISQEFSAEPARGDRVYGFLAGIYPTRNQEQE